MSKRTTAVVIVALVFYTGITTFGVGWLSWERRAQEKLLEKLALAKPGIRLSDVRGQLGRPMGEYAAIDDVVSWGNVKDRVFCTDKKLFRFYVSTPPCRAVDVYTDANDVIVYATWTGL